MSFLCQFAEFLLLSVVALDTLGFVAESRKNSARSENRDYLRLCFTWVFFLTIRSLSCTMSCVTGCGYIGSLFGMLFFSAKVFISIPAIGGTETLYSLLIEQNVMKRYLLDAYHMIKPNSVCGQQ